MTIKLPTQRTKREPKPDIVPKRIRETADREGWEVQTLNSFWTRLKKDGVSIEFRRDLRSQYSGAAYVRDIICVEKFNSQREIIEYMESQ